MKVVTEPRTRRSGDARGACGVRARRERKNSPPRQRGGGPRGRLRDAPSHESGDVAPPESDKPPYTHGQEGFLLGELVDHGIGHVQECYDLLHVHEGLAQDILGGVFRQADFS